jgi:hypothetical protein
VRRTRAGRSNRNKRKLPLFAIGYAPANEDNLFQIVSLILSEIWKKRAFLNLIQPAIQFA